jgi:hypothetical protein
MKSLMYSIVVAKPMASTIRPIICTRVIPLSTSQELLSGFRSCYQNNKTDYPSDYEHASRSSSQNPRLPLPSYGQTTPSYVPHTQFTPTSQAPETHALPVPSDIPLLSGQYTPRDASTYQNPSNATFIEDRSRITPEIISQSPFTAEYGKLRILLRSLTDYTAERYSFFVSFDYTKCQAILSKDFVQTPFHHFILTVDVPRFETPKLEGTSPRISSSMALLLEIQDENHVPVDTKSLGSFIYQGIQRKRKNSEENPEYLHAKRSASQPLHASKYKDSSSVYSGTALAMSPAGSSYSGALYPVPASYDRPVHQRAAYSSQTISHRPSYYPSLSPSLTPASMRVRRSPTMQHYGSSHLAQVQSPRVPLQQQHSGVSMARSLSAISNPPLVRTSTMKTPRQTQFNPYEMYPPNTKVTLKLEGSLSSVTENWTREENLAARRLVEFSCLRQGGEIRTSFKPVTVDDRNPTLPVVSCIYWERKKQYYVTSVEIIVLLESVLSIRFTVEEKNRIRRNLEGFKPLTVAKANDDYDDIFKLIMGFPNPKPRNIEKDLKIFPWTTLENALKKIVSKYVSARILMCWNPTDKHISLQIIRAQKA